MNPTDDPMDFTLDEDYDPEFHSLIAKAVRHREMTRDEGSDDGGDAAPAELPESLRDPAAVWEKAVRAGRLEP